MFVQPGDKLQMDESVKYMKWGSYVSNQIDPNAPHNSHPVRHTVNEYISENGYANIGKKSVHESGEEARNYQT